MSNISPSSSREPIKKRPISGAAPPDVVTLAIEGELDIVAAPAFRDTVFTAIGAKPAVLLLDLRTVRFVDSVGLSSLVTVARVARMMGVSLRVLPSPYLARLLEQTGLSKLVPLLEG